MDAADRVEFRASRASLFFSLGRVVHGSTVRGPGQLGLGNLLRFPWWAPPSSPYIQEASPASEEAGRAAPGNFPQRPEHLGRSLQRPAGSPAPGFVCARAARVPHLDFHPRGGCLDQAPLPTLHSALLPLLLVAFPREPEERGRDIEGEKTD